MDLDKQREYLDNRNLLFALSDVELINKIIEDRLYLGVIFEKYKDDFPKKIRKNYSKTDFPTIQDIFTESVCDLYDKILTSGLSILERKDSSIAGYLMGICINKMKNEKVTHTSRFIRTDVENQNADDSYDTNSGQIEFHVQEQDLIKQQDLLYNQTLKQYEVLEIMKNKGGKCYSLILLSFSSEYNYRIRDLRELFNYKNNHSTTNQKSKCMDRLKNMYNNFQLA